MPRVTTWRSGMNHVLAICHVLIQVGSHIKVFNLRMFGMFSGALAKLRKATVSLVMCVCVSVRLAAWNNLAPTGRICIELHSCIFFRKSVEEFQVPLKCDKNNGHFTWRPVYMFNDITLSSSFFSTGATTHCGFIFCSPLAGSSRTRFLYHTQRRATIGRTPLDEWSFRRRDLYLTAHNTHNRQTSMPPVGFEPTISAGERP